MIKKPEPWAEILSMRDQMDKIMNESMNLDFKTGNLERRLSLWQPVSDLYETESHLVIEMELPGVLQENVSLEVHGSQIVVFGEKRLEKEASKGAYRMLERSYGPFSRVFVLPDNIESSSIKAVFRNGILRVLIPKAIRKDRPVSITISER